MVHGRVYYRTTTVTDLQHHRAHSCPSCCETRLTGQGQHTSNSEAVAACCHQISASERQHKANTVFAHSQASESDDTTRRSGGTPTGKTADCTPRVRVCFNGCRHGISGRVDLRTTAVLDFENYVAHRSPGSGQGGLCSND